MSEQKIKFQVFLNNDEAEHVRELCHRLTEAGLTGSVSESIRFLVRKGLKHSGIGQ